MCHEDWYNRTSFIDQLQARTTRQAPSIRVPQAGHAAHYILLLIRVFLSFAAYLPHMPLDRKETEDWLRPVWTGANKQLHTLSPLLYLFLNFFRAVN
uniref:Transposase n=1 Tax=Mesocestoides corti TaxID=53468 RepID=A0A5K3EIN5_MESCO